MNTLFRKMLRDLRAMWPQTLALVVIMTLGVSGFIGLISAYRDLGTSYRNTYDQLRFADVTFQVDSAPAGISADITQLDGVAAVTGRLRVDAGLDLPDGDQVRARLLGLPGDGQPAVNQLWISEGRMLAAGDTNAAVLESAFAGLHDLHPGDTITPILNGQPTPLTLVGIASSPEYLIVSPSQQEIFPSPRSFAVIFLPLSTLQEAMNAGDAVNEFALRLRPDADQSAVAAAAGSVLQPYQIESTIWQGEQPSNAALQQDLDGYRELASLMPTLIIAVAAISVYVMLGRMVRAQQPQIGLMKALGYSSRAVLGHYLAFALAIGVLGMVLGVAAGIPLGRWITQTYASELGIPLVRTHVYADLIVPAAAFSLIASILAGWGPARQSARMAPAAAMRLDPAAALSDGHLSLLERWIRPPLWLRLPLRNVFRQRRRALTTGLGIVFAFILILMVLGMIDAMRTLQTQTFEEVERWDVAAVFDTPQVENTLTRVRSWAGVAEAVAVMQMPASLHTPDASQDILLTALPPEQDMHVLPLAAGISPAQALADGQIVLTDALARQLGVQPGDPVTLDTPLGRQTLHLSATVTELMSAAAYVSLAQARKLSPLPVPIFNGIYLRVDPARAKSIKRDLYRLPGAASVQVKAETRQDFDQLVGLFWAFMLMMLGFVLVMAFALLFNAATVNVLERQRELATMRAIGSDKWRIAGNISLETALLWLLALVPGLLLGTWTAVQMGQAFSAELFEFDIHISWESYLLTSAGILLTMLLAAIPAIRRVNRLNLAEATKILT